MAAPDSVVGSYAGMLRTAQRALEDAKLRTGPVPVAFGRFQQAERDLADLRKGPDQDDTRSRLAALIASLESVPAEQLPLWPIIPAIGSAILVLARQERIAAIVAAGAGALFTVGELANTKPSSTDGLRLRLDVDASAKKAKEDMDQTLKERDSKDTADIEQETRSDAQKRSVDRAVKAGVPKFTTEPSWNPLPKKDDPTGTKQRFGYWKDGKFVEVPTQQQVEVRGKRGMYDAQGRFIPNAT